MKILATGLTGLVGSRVQELLGDKYQFENFGRHSGIDITDPDLVRDKILSSDFDIFLHLAGKTHVDGCEEDLVLDQKFLRNEVGVEEIKSKKTAWAVNVLGTKNIADSLKEKEKKLVYISTDFVFDGEENPGYTEEDVPNPINWYGKTKYEGEKRTETLDKRLIVRISYPYRAKFERLDFVRTALSFLKDKREISMVEDHIMTPTYIDDLVKGLDTLLEIDASGLYHLTGSQFLSPYAAANIIADKFGMDRGLISKTTRSEFFKDRAPRPFFLGMKNDRITKLGVSMKSFEEGIDELKIKMEEGR